MTLACTFSLTDSQKTDRSASIIINATGNLTLQIGNEHISLPWSFTELTELDRDFGELEDSNLRIERCGIMPNMKPGIVVTIQDGDSNRKEIAFLWQYLIQAQKRALLN